MKKLGKLKKVRSNTIEYFTSSCYCFCDCACSCYSECFDACYGVQPEINFDFNYIGATNFAAEEQSVYDGIEVEDMEGI